MKVLLFGGSFDPPHIGHAALLAAAARRIRPDRVLIIPAFHAPLKAGHSASVAQRLRMVELGLLPSLPRRWRKRTKVYPREARSRRRVFTIETVKRIQKEHPDWELHFVAGADAAASWPRWRSPKRLARLCSWWTARRPGAPKRLPSHFRLLRGAMPDVSSTVLRADLAAGLDVSRRLQPKVLRFIEREGLYGTAVFKTLERGLKPGRWEHTLAVRRLAEALARRWREDPRQASRAALLHDCGRLLPRRRYAAYARARRLAVPGLSDIARRKPGLLHAYVGADLARRRLGCRDRAVLDAVRRHTLGAPAMTRLDRLLYVADAASEDRSHPEAPRLRRLALRDLDAAFRACLRAKLRHALNNASWLHPRSVALWNSLCAR